MSRYSLPLLILLYVSCTSQPESTTTRIAFGSCAHEDKDLPMLSVASQLNPDAFIFLGDNIYGDTRNMDTLVHKYSKLASKPEFQQLLEQTTVLATWDDHDYGENDAGRHYPFKEESKSIFLDFWKVPIDSDRRKHPGIFGVEYLETEGPIVQIILLDNRTFRDDLIFREPNDSLVHKNDYIPNTNPDSTFLGEAQWAWLEQQLMEEADVRIIASSNQFSHTYNGWESWTNVPHERQRMTDLIRSTKAEGVLFISGDVHWGEISRLDLEDQYPLYDVTSSGISETWDVIEPNSNRIGKAIPQNNIGLIEIVTIDDHCTIRLMIIDGSQQPVVSHSLDLEELGF